MKRIAAIGVLTMILGCARTLPPPEGTALLPEIDVVQVKENSDEALRLAQEAKLDVEALNAKVTDLGNRLASVSEDIASISVAKIEEIENRVALLTEEMKSIQKLLESVELKKKRPPPRPMATFNPSTAKKSQPPKLVPKKIDNVKPSLKGGNHEAYQAALRTFNSRDYNTAIRLFKELLEEAPKGTYADNCVFWVGECFYGLRDFAQAIGWYKRVASYTDTEKSDDAQFKVAKSYLKLGESSQAAAEYEKLLTRYPSSEYVGRAKADLEKLKSR